MKADTLKEANKLMKQIEKLEDKRSEFFETENNEEKISTTFPDVLFDKSIQLVFTEEEMKAFNQYCVSLLDKKIKAKQKEFNNL